MIKKSAPNLSALKEQYEKLGKEINKLEQAEAETAEENPMTLFRPDLSMHGQEIFVLEQNVKTGLFSATSTFVADGDEWEFAFRTIEGADKAADALNVMFKLRTKRGACSYGDGSVDIFSVDDNLYDDEERAELRIGCTYPIGGIISGFFRTRFDAEKALAEIGEEEIWEAVKTLTGATHNV